MATGGPDYGTRLPSITRSLSFNVSALPLVMYAVPAGSVFFLTRFWGRIVTKNISLSIARFKITGVIGGTRYLLDREWLDNAFSYRIFDRTYTQFIGPIDGGTDILIENDGSSGQQVGQEVYASGFGT